MTGETHRQGGMLCSIVGFTILQHKGLLLPADNLNLCLQWLIIYPFCMWGSVASDLDHHWESCPSKSYPDRIVNTALHITKPIQKSLEKTNQTKGPLYKVAKLFNASHRSWQTHSDLTLFFMLWLINLVTSGGIKGFSAIDTSICSLILMGICLGILTHFILDVLTPDGVWLCGFVVLNKLLKKINPRIHLPEKLHFVPKSHFFATGGQWELFVRRVLKILTYIALTLFLLNLLNIDLMSFLPMQIKIY